MLCLETLGPGIHVDSHQTRITHPHKTLCQAWFVQHAVMNELPITLMQTITWNNNRTSGFIVRFLPVKNDKRRAALHSDHSEVRRRYAGRTSHVLITSLLIREVSKGWGDGARLIGLLIGLVDHMGGYGQVQWKQHFYSCQSLTSFYLCSRTEYCC